MGHIRNTHAAHKKGLKRHVNKIAGKRKVRSDRGATHKRVKKA